MHLYYSWKSNLEMEHPELICNATEPFSGSPNAWPLLAWRGTLSNKQSYYLKFKWWFKKISQKMSQRSRTEPDMLGWLVLLNKKTKGRMLILDSRVANWKRRSMIYLSAWIVLGDLTNVLTYISRGPSRDGNDQSEGTECELCPMMHGRKKRYWKYPYEKKIKSSTQEASSDKKSYARNDQRTRHTVWYFYMCSSIL